MSGFLPITKEEMEERGIDQFDFICVTGDAYVDHPSFGIAIISRMLESQGYTVGMIAQPHYHTLHDFEKFGSPKYGFLLLPEISIPWLHITLLPNGFERMMLIRPEERRESDRIVR